MLKNIGFSFLLLPISLFGEVSDYAKARMCAGLDTIQDVFESQYAPIEWKESYTGWNLAQEIEYAKSQVLGSSDLSIKDYQRIVRAFFKSTQDFHVNVNFYSTESASLPFYIKSAEGRYFIASLEKGESRGGLQIGDEVISFNGQPIAEAILDFRIADCGPGETLSDQSFAEIFFTKRIGALAHLVPQGEVILGVIHKGSARQKYYTFDWDYTPEEVNNIALKPRFALEAGSLLAAGGLKVSPKIPLHQNPIFKKSMRSPLAKWVTPKAGEGIGSRQSYLPSLGKKIWVSHPDSPFHAYLFETSDHHRYGYIRIPSYDGDSYEFEEFRELIERLEFESEALVIDQLNNPGGSVFYMYALLSVLSDTPLYVPPHRIALTQKDVALSLEALPYFEAIETDFDAMDELGNSLGGMPVTAVMAHQVADYFKFTLSQWNLGISFTAPYPIWGIDYIVPDEDVRYTKPILLLINEMDLSCGDFFPSILQDSKRATLMGTKTAGAGGFVLNASYPNQFGIADFSYTGSIAYRPDNTPIENLGVTPEIEYNLTVQDMQRFYFPLRDAILENVKKLRQ